MDALELLQAAFEHLHQAVRDDLAQVEREWLWWQPGPGLNHIGFLHWHLVRDEDTVLAYLAGEEDVWQSGGWSERLGMDPEAQGTGLDPAELASFRYDTDTFTGYRDHVWATTSPRLARLEPAALREAAWPGSTWDVAQQLVEGCLCHSWLHLGEVRMIMGLRGWRFRE
ncbi:MAG: hypothetical protein Kow0010_09580 [Dehalococcoidia bacterium]